MTIFAPNTIIHGDCLAVLPQLPAGSINFALTDPPYLARYRRATAGLSRTTTPMLG